MSDTLEPLATKSSVSALSRRAAVEKLTRVRVEGSKNRFTTVLPCKSGRFLCGNWLTSTNPSALSRIASISSRLSSSRSSR